MITIFITLLPIFLLVFIGLLAERFRMIPRGAGPIINQFVLNLSLPAMIFGALASRSPEELDHFNFILTVILTPTICYLFPFIISTNFFRKNIADGCMTSFLSCFPNALFLGLPVLILLFPNNEDVVLGSTLAAILTTPFMLMSMIVLDIQRDKGNISGWAICKKITRSLLYNPLIWAFCLGLIVCINEIVIPKALLTTFRFLGSTSSPCALVAIGMAFGVQLGSWRTIKINVPRQCMVSTIKMVLQPLVAGLIFVMLGVDGIWLCTGVLIMGTPTGTLAFAISEEYQVSVQDSAFAILLNTTISIFSIPLTVMILNYLGYC